MSPERVAPVRYGTFEEEEEIDLMAVWKEREQLKAELAKLEEQMAGYLKELGYE